MKSKINISSHPVHPMLVVFPIAFFSGSLIFDLLGWIFLQEDLLDVAFYLDIAGILGAIIAAIPGLLDYLYTVPPKSSAKTRAMKHGIINTLVLLIFIGVLLLKLEEEIAILLIVVVELIAVVLMCIAAWMGGTLVYRNQVGVDHRFAYAGKYQEQYFDEANGSIEVGSMDELKTDQMKLLHLNDKRIVLAKTESGFTAFDDRCTHKGASLADGAMICGTVQCPWHGSQFDAKTGQVKAGPANAPIETYLVEERDGKLYLNL